MVKQLFCVTLVAWLVVLQVLSKEQSSQQKLETVKKSLDIDNLVTTARRLRNSVASVTREIEKTYVQNDHRLRFLVESSVNDAITASLTTINEVASSVNTSNNSAAKSCVTSAQRSLALSTTFATMSAANCSLEISIKTFNFASKMASLENMLSSSIFKAESNCPSIYLIDDSLDLPSAQNCYIQAAAELKNCINLTSTEIKKLYPELKVLQQNGTDCITKGSQLAAQGGQAAVSTMINCGRNAGALLFPVNVTEAINTNTLQIDQFSLNVSTILESGIDMFHELDDLRVQSEIESSLECFFGYIQGGENYMRYIERPEGLPCIESYKAQYNTVLQSAVNSTSACANKSYEYIDPTPLLQSRERLQTILRNASAEAASQCTRPSLSSTITKDSVNSCMAAALDQLRTEALAIVEHPRFTSIRNQLNNTRSCITSGRIDAFKAAIIIGELLVKCVNQHDVTVSITCQLD